MPIYEFKCKKCGELFEALRSVGDTGRGLVCPACGSKAVEKQLSTFAVTGVCSKCPSAPT